MKKHFQTTLLGLSISLILCSLVVNVSAAKTTTSQINYGYYYHFNDLDEKKYHRFLPNPPPEELFYQTRMAVSANIDDTPGKETVVIMVVGTKPRAGFSSWHQAFLLITNTKARKLQKKAFFKLFDTGVHPLKVPAAEAIELHATPLNFIQPTDVSFRLIDVTDDGTLDVWVESEHGVALFSFHNGEFKEVFGNYLLTREKLTETPDIESYIYNIPSDPEGEKYHRFLAAPPPEGLYYNTRQKAGANINDTPEKETIVLITADTGVDGPRGEWVQAFLLIAENEADGLPKKKDLFKLFDAGTHAFDVPGKTIEVRNAPWVFRKVRKGRPWFYYGVSFELVDLTGDGILDIWVECAYGIAVITFQDGEFKKVCRAYSSPRREDPIEYIDIDNDGIYEIKISDSISINGAPGAADLEWISFYEWDGTTYVLNNRRFYANNDKFFARLLEEYNFWHYYAIQDEYSFYIGLVFYYRGNPAMAQKYLQWVVRNVKNNDYIEAAESILKELTHH